MPRTTFVLVHGAWQGAWAWETIIPRLEAAGQRSARALAIVAALLSLSELPFGIALGTYTLVVLLRATPAPPYVAAATGA